jgi:hypothetical protein
MTAITTPGFGNERRHMTIAVARCSDRADVGCGKASALRFFITHL